ncbi:hypothetical protein BDF22DRAFT_652826 [Syncephalis plumigaleata]|nr:hypothetical protein BDF22DRAFT_652826 [Syncephalis plumigaleata]
MTNRHTDLRDADRQVKRGIEMIQDAYDRRTAELSSEVDHYKQQAASQRQEAVQLETFRKSIVNMVEYSPTTPINMADLEQSFSEAALARGIGRMDPFQIANYALPEEFLRGSTFDGEDEAAAALMAESGSARRGRGDTTDRKTSIRSHTRQNLYETPATSSSRRHNSDDTDNLLWRIGGRTSASRAAPAGANPTPSISHETSPLSMNRHTQERRTPYSAGGKTVDLRGSVITNGSASRATRHLQQTTRNVISDEELLEDAGIVYRRIRDVLSPQDFDRFAQAVSAFNAQQATASETMREVERLVVDRNLLQVCFTCVSAH